MPAARYFTRIDTVELKVQIERRLGRIKACKYFNLLSRFLSLKISKCELDKLCIATIGRENVRLHNHLIRSIIRNASLSNIPPSNKSKVEGSLNVKTPNGFQVSSLQSLCRDFPQSPRKGRTPSLRDRRLRDRPSPLGPQGKKHSTACEDSVPKVQEQQNTSELHSLGSRPPGSVEDGEEVDQDYGSPSIYSRSPVRAPLGISIHTREIRKVLHNGFSSASFSENCYNCGELPETSSLRKRLGQKLEMEGLKILDDGANLLNNALDLYLKRLIKPCLELAGSKSAHKQIDQIQNCTQPGLPGMQAMRFVQKPSAPVSASISDFQTAVELNPVILGEDWPLVFEKVGLRASEN
ncbi:Transcriptional coactivator Hfi1/Transcriptional adapter 1 [Quillaja saponaria]|uniref:Transcriptional coactivator Hfi1/Transcriptional adapter 1 n=1 Tax=Quillaja saponaria TaxID=32244 RepID=A0AAD7L7B2_QUISA|nr:Transcriptional coactivator Hfi1/Transcriptional adapter 1 [Quillaja saponaria]